MRDFEGLRVWREAFALAAEVYERTAQLPVHEQYGLMAQARRSAVSIASNIAEGAGRASDSDFARFLAIASGSASELLTQLMLASHLHGLDCADLESRVRSVRKMLWGLNRALIP